jgi:hypothetical protein
LWCFRLFHGHVYYEQSSDDVSPSCGLLSSKAVNDGLLYHHVALVRHAASLSMYIDGTLDSTTNSIDGVSDIVNTAPLIAGQAVCQCCDGTVPFVGALDELGLYSRALTPAEIKTYYDATREGEKRPANL